MTVTTIEQLRIPETLDGDAAADFHQAVEVSRQVRIKTWGNDKLAYTAEELFDQCHDTFEWYVVLIARRGGEILGLAGIALPLDDNTDMAHVTLDVLPSAEGLGLGRKLLEAAELFVKGENRKIVMVETSHQSSTLDDADTEVIPASRGGGSLPLSSREARFAYNAGYDLERVEQFSVCALPLPVGLSAVLTERATAAHEHKYRVHQWMDRCPESWAQDIVRLEQEIEGEGDGNPEVAWDVARLREAEEISMLTGRHTLVSAAECVEAGVLVGLTSISILGNRGDVAFQDDSFVEQAHRGKDVGLHIQTANLEHLMREFPQLDAIYTWNAPEKEYMRSVNEMLGFVNAGVTGQWRKDFNSIG
ncbi:GNAT family N-acetyltransferase [Arthrobacter sp.]|uniref:GNAT family N-acetyltransferase n=1 Tax=Arthrobacter sp. TaxID=1667 RepID=UPI0026DF603B|nr:GNAT family N-acetyltransferase [Arthrobacter sp.]MDO5752281.1 GNAT family N-acetyltransferase [Arthrobacter sp.]